MPSGLQEIALLANCDPPPTVGFNPLIAGFFICFATSQVDYMRASQRPCSWPGCNTLVISGRCDRHKHAASKEYDRQRGSASNRMYDRRWQAASKDFLRRHPLCQCPDCQEGRVRVTASSVVDHIVPHKGDIDLFWNESNWQAMSKPCHDKKTATEDGGFGNQRAPRVG